MKEKIYKVKNDLRALKKSSHALNRLIELHGLCYKRVKVIEGLDGKREGVLAEREREIALALGIKAEILKSQELTGKYARAIGSLDAEDKAMILDCYLNGLPYWKIAMEYGFSEEGARKHIDKIVKKIAKAM